MVRGALWLWCGPWSSCSGNCVGQWKETTLSGDKDQRLTLVDTLDARPTVGTAGEKVVWVHYPLETMGPGQLILLGQAADGHFHLLVHPLVLAVGLGVELREAGPDL